MKVLLTGGAGYIGAHTCVELIEAGHEAVVVDNYVNSSPEAMKRVKALIGSRPIDIEIDGGVTPETAPLVAAAGANVLVAGSAVFKGGTEASYRTNIEAIRAASDGAMRKAA